jgi:hypothetical protein
MSCAVTRSRCPARRTLPSTTVATFSRCPISRTSAFLPLNAKAEVRAATRSPDTLPSAVMSSSVIPSAKYSFSRSGLRLVKGRTATDGPLAVAGALTAAAAGAFRDSAVWRPEERRQSPYRPARTARTSTPPRTRAGRARVVRAASGAGAVVKLSPARSAAANSPAVAKRSAGTFASARVTAASTPGGTARTLPRCGTGSLNRLAMRACAVGPVNGGSPASIS